MAQALPFQVNEVIVGVPLPLKSYEISRSPGERGIVALVEAAVQPLVAFWFSSKSMWASPLFDSRIQER